MALEDIKLVNPVETRNYLRMKSSIKKNNRLDEGDINSMTRNIFAHRDKFNKLFTASSFMFYVLAQKVFPCCLRKRDNRKLNLYRNGIARYYKEVDIVKILKAVRI